MAVGNPLKKPIIGILGGIGSGKTTAAREFAKLGCAVIDADEIAHELLDEPAIKERIVSLFGRAVLGDEGRISRDELAAVVFSDREKLDSLCGILHPPVLAETERLLERYEADAEVKAIVLDMPLLVEIGWDKRCERLIFVDCDEKKRRKRLQNAGKSGFFNKNQLKSRENFQIPLDKKAEIADDVVDNNSDCSALVRQIADIFNNIMGAR